MQAIGVISEWNPFHNGHRYLLIQMHAAMPEAAVIGIMSGNYVQRGEPAVLSKWQRATLALQHGCDIVVELPMWSATAPADLFAHGGVAAAIALGCEALAFGSESEHFVDYERLAAWVVHHPHWQDALPTDPTVNRGQFQLQALAQLPKQIPALRGLNIDFTDASNTLLAFSYAKANIEQGAPLRLLPVQRLGNSHRSQAPSAATSYASSTAIRRLLRAPKTAANCEQLAAITPQDTLALLEELKTVPTWEAWYPYVRYLLLSQSLTTLATYYQVYEGIETVFQRVAKTALTLEDFLHEVTNRQWTVGRVKRALLMIALGVTDSEMTHLLSVQQPLLLLGATTKGRQYLKQHTMAREQGHVLINRVDHQAQTQWPMWLRGDRLYQTFLNPDAGEQNYGHPPIFVR